MVSTAARRCHQTGRVDEVRGEGRGIGWGRAGPHLVVPPQGPHELADLPQHSQVMQEVLEVLVQLIRAQGRTPCKQARDAPRGLQECPASDSPTLRHPDSHSNSDTLTLRHGNTQAP